MFSCKRRYVAIGLIVVFLILVFIFAKRNYSISSSLAPLPTAINPNFLTQVDDCFIPTAAVYGYTLRIVSGFRSMAQQQQYMMKVGLKTARSSLSAAGT